MIGNLNCINACVGGGHQGNVGGCVQGARDGGGVNAVRPKRLLVGTQFDPHDDAHDVRHSCAGARAPALRVDAHVHDARSGAARSPAPSWLQLPAVATSQVRPETIPKTAHQQKVPSKNMLMHARHPGVATPAQKASG